MWVTEEWSAWWKFTCLHMCHGPLGICSSWIWGYRYDQFFGSNLHGYKFLWFLCWFLIVHAVVDFLYFKLILICFLVLCMGGCCLWFLFIQNYSLCLVHQWVRSNVFNTNKQVLLCTTSNNWISRIGNLGPVWQHAVQMFWSSHGKRSRKRVWLIFIVVSNISRYRNLKMILLRFSFFKNNSLATFMTIP